VSVERSEDLLRRRRRKKRLRIYNICEENTLYGVWRVDN